MNSNIARVLFGFLLIAILSLLLTPIHILLLANPFWFRKSWLAWFGRTQALQYFSAINWDWGLLFGWL